MNRQQRRSKPAKKAADDLASLWANVAETLRKEGITPQDIADEFQTWKKSNDAYQEIKKGDIPPDVIT